MMLRVIDTETCGLQGGVVEVASVDVIDGQIVNPMSDLVSPDRPISRQAMAVHRITEAMVMGKPPIEEAILRYHGSPFYVAHNASFDRRMLPEMHGEWICTMTLARQLWPGIKYGNQALRHSLKLDVTPASGFACSPGAVRLLRDGRAAHSNYGTVRLACGRNESALAACRAA
ncbi:DNA polymerase III epsilon subunit-like protein [Pantoea ananatis]